MSEEKECAKALWQLEHSIYMELQNICVVKVQITKVWQDEAES